MFSDFRQDIFNNLKNIPGWHTKRKIVVIECDDWGSIRMPSKKVFERLINKGLNVATGRYNIFDTLETGQDLEELFEVLKSVKDINNQSAVMTAMTLMANPDFNKIRASGFTEYHYEKFTETLTRYYPNDNVFKLWREGISARIWMPELHGREHITVQLWMQKLRENDKDLIFAFNNGFVSLRTPGLPSPAQEFRPEYYFVSDIQKSFLIKSIIDSTEIFREIFDCQPHVFVPSNGIFHPDFDKIVSDTGVKFLYVSSRMPYPAENGTLRFRTLFPGQKGPNELTYYNRNCVFEPNDKNYKGIELTLKQIEAAFRWRKPANISTHRVNFSGGIDPENRTKGLLELKKLLKTIVQKWPDVEFMSSRDALNHMRAII